MSKKDKEIKIEGPAGRYINAFFEIMNSEEEMEKAKLVSEHTLAFNIIDVINQNSKKLDDISITKLTMAAGTLFLKDPAFEGWEKRQLIEQEF